MSARSQIRHSQSLMQTMRRQIALSHGQLTDRPVFIEQAYVDLIWPHVEGMIEKSFRRADLDSMDNTKADVLAGNALLWIVWNGAKITSALVTKITKPHDTKICILVACGGKGNWPVLIETIEDYARSEGCAITRIYGRKGWLRALKDYKMTRVVIDKTL